MELFAERLRLAAQSAVEDNRTDTWPTALPKPVLVKLRRAWKEATRDVISTGEGQSAIESITDDLAFSVGYEFAGMVHTGDDLLQSGLDTPLAMSVLEAMYNTFDMESVVDDDNGQRFFVSQVNSIFEAHRIALRMMDGQIVPLSSLELNNAVVEPASYLLHGRADLRGGHRAYMKALEEIRRGDAADAITDAGTALQETLEALGCDGHSLGALTDSARRKGLLAAHDDRLTQAIELFLRWAGKERNEGEAHHAVESELSDAWLMVHVVGALIVRLADATGRGTCC